MGCESHNICLMYFYFFYYWQPLKALLFFVWAEKKIEINSAGLLWDTVYIIITKWQIRKDYDNSSWINYLDLFCDFYPNCMIFTIILFLDAVWAETITMCKKSFLIGRYDTCHDPDTDMRARAHNKTQCSVLHQLR